MTDVDRAIAHAAARLGLSHEAAQLLPPRVVAELWGEKQRTEAATPAARTTEEDE